MNSNTDQTIQKWLLVEKQLKQLHDKTKELREIKHGLSQQICEYIEINKIPKLNTIDGSSIKKVEKREYTILSYTYLEKSLLSIIPDKTQVEFIISHLKSNREIRTTHELVIIPNKKTV